MTPVHIKEYPHGSNPMTIFTSREGCKRIINHELRDILGHPGPHRPDGTSRNQIGITTKVRPRRGAASHTSPRHGKRLRGLSVKSFSSLTESVHPITGKSSLVESTKSHVAIENNEKLDFALWLTKNQANEDIGNSTKKVDNIIQVKIRGERLRKVEDLEKIEHAVK
jgi:hypothetical protein